MSAETIILYFISIIIFFSYSFLKFKWRSYIISINTIGLYIYTFDILISPIFYFQDASWAALGIGSASSMAKYLDRGLTINLIGYIVYLITLVICEFNGKRNHGIYSLCRIVAHKINKNIVDILFYCTVTVWYLVVFVYCKGMPLLNGDRTFFLDTPISPVYNALNGVIGLCMSYYCFNFTMYKQNKLSVIIGVITILFTGNRAPLITGVLFPIVIMAIYKRYGGYQATLKIFAFIPVMVIFGLLITIIRTGNGIDFLEFAREIFYGNTFCDMRDGAYILKGFSETFNDRAVHGKTYIAALLSFIPSSLSDYRLKWSWGRLTTTGLFGRIGHFGFRGGNVMEGYLNFGWLGVIICAVIQGFFLGELEKIFYNIFITKRYKITGKEYFIFGLISAINGFFTTSSSAYNIYVYVLFICFMMMVSASKKV